MHKVGTRATSKHRVPSYYLLVRILLNLFLIFNIAKTNSTDRRPKHHTGRRGERRPSPLLPSSPFTDVGSNRKAGPQTNRIAELASVASSVRAVRNMHRSTKRKIPSSSSLQFASGELTSDTASARQFGWTLSNSGTPDMGFFFFAKNGITNVHMADK